MLSGNGKIISEINSFISASWGFAVDDEKIALKDDQKTCKVNKNATQVAFIDWLPVRIELQHVAIYIPGQIAVYDHASP
jgi:hypothetical protein